MTRNRVLVYGAAGHTGRFIAAEVARRGLRQVLAGRDGAKLAPIGNQLGAEYVEVEVTDSVGLARLAASADAIINAAGPFGDTSPSLIEAALEARIPYFDVTGEPFVAKEIFERYAARAKKADIAVAPAFGFFGALGDLLVTAAMRDWRKADRVELAFALDSWKPTRGSRLAGERRAGRRLVHQNGEFGTREAHDPMPSGSRRFEAPFGVQPMVGEFSTVDVVTVSRHIDVDRIDTWINEAPLADMRDGDQSGPVAVDKFGRSAQQFAIEVTVQKGEELRTARASGQDIYAVTAPLVIEAVSWIWDGRARKTGTVSASELFDSMAFLDALSPDPFSVEIALG